jgi:tRNA pseudouridine38-40 synthase
MQDRISGREAGKPVTSFRNIRLTLAYDGTAYHGWQVQADQSTIQGIVCDAIRHISGEEVSLTGSGRTDAGTHARRLTANFATHSRIRPPSWVRALNSILPHDIRVLSARRVAHDFHSRRDAISKIYRYQIFCGAILPPHLAREHYHYPHPIDITLMEKAARLFIGEHDFASFTPAKISSSKKTVRRILRCELKKRGLRLLFSVEGNGFLQYMVRNMIGTLLELGRGRITPRQFEDLFGKRDRTLAGFTAPAHGLVLIRVRY